MLDQVSPAVKGEHNAPQQALAVSEPDACSGNTAPVKYAIILADFYVVRGTRIVNAQVQLMLWDY